MKLYWSKTSGLDPARAIHPGRSRADGSAFAWSLLAFALRHDWLMELPRVETTPGGKPYFPDVTELHFSLSHTRGAVLAAISRYPVGADVEYHRQFRESTARRLMETPHGDLELFELWTLRESWYKLTGRGDLRTIPFSRANGVILLPEPIKNVFCSVYDEIPNCTAAVCCEQELPPENLIQVDGKLLLETQR